MKRTLVGLVSFGNTSFTQLTINSIRESTKSPIEFVVVVGKPGDNETEDWLCAHNIPRIVHMENRGFTVSLNDIVDYAFPSLCGGLGPDYDYLILAGNDIVPYPGAVDALINEAAQSEWEMIGSSMFDAQSLTGRYPEAAKYFEGPNLTFNHWHRHVNPGGVVEYTPTVRPWEMHKDIHPYNVEPNILKDVMNLNLFKRSAFEKVGYFDPNFWPGGYFSDNDFCVRANRAGVKSCGLSHSAFFHWWSRTIHQGETGRPNNQYFDRNAKYYQDKFGGPVNGETFALPFNNPENSLRITSRSEEDAVIAKWRDMQ